VLDIEDVKKLPDLEELATLGRTVSLIQLNTIQMEVFKITSVGIQMVKEKLSGALLLHLPLN